MGLQHLNKTGAFNRCGGCNVFLVNKLVLGNIEQLTRDEDYWIDFQTRVSILGMEGNVQGFVAVPYATFFHATSLDSFRALLEFQAAQDRPNLITYAAGGRKNRIKSIEVCK